MYQYVGTEFFVTYSLNCNHPPLSNILHVPIDTFSYISLTVGNTDQLQSSELRHK